VAAGLSVDPGRWREQFDELMERIAGRFPRVEPRRRARAFGLGLLSGLRRKNCWTIAEQAGDASPDGMQHLLAAARWDVGGVRDDLLALAFLSIAAATEHTRPPPAGQIPITRNDIAALFSTLIIETVQDTQHRLRWSTWRCRRQHRARTCHYQRQARHP
jgi:hypothetical protein